MTETLCETKNYKIDHSTFGGTIYPTDYYTDYPRHSDTPHIAARIVSDWDFDEWCRRNNKRRAKNRNRNKIYGKG